MKEHEKDKEQDQDHTVHISIGGRVGDIVGKINCICGQNRWQIEGIFRQNMGAKSTKKRITYILNRKQWESDDLIVEFL